MNEEIWSWEDTAQDGGWFIVRMVRAGVFGDGTEDVYLY